MSQTERLFRINQLLSLGKCLSPERLLVDLGVSAATVKRDIAHLRQRMNAPIVFDRDRRGWCMDRSQPSVGTTWRTASRPHATTQRHARATANAAPTTANATACSRVRCMGSSAHHGNQGCSQAAALAAKPMTAAAVSRPRRPKR